MLDITHDELGIIKKNFAGKKIVVIGDMMLDCYFWGDVKRISPEAPVPVVEVDDEFYRFGGAANVAYNIIKLGGIPVPIGVIGNDNAGEKLTALMQRAGLYSDGIIIDNSRPTTAKTRVIAENHHVVRIDRESKLNISSDVQQKILDFFERTIDSIDAVILQDYNKGVLTPSIIRKVIEIAGNKNKIITVDPKFDNFFKYKNVTLFKPNRKETEAALGRRISNNEEVTEAIIYLKKTLSCEGVLITLGENGMCLLESNDEIDFIPTKAKKVHDVSGAGDTVISTLTLALVAGATMKEATSLSNYAAGVVCSEVGVVPIQLNQLIEAI